MFKLKKINFIDINKCPEKTLLTLLLLVLLSLLSRQDSIVAGMVLKPSINTFAISAMFLDISRIFSSNPRVCCISPWPPELVAGLVAPPSAILKFSQHTPQNISKIIKIINILHYCHYFPYIHIACLYSELNIIFHTF